MSSNFDGGNGTATKAERVGEKVNVELTITKEPFTEGTDKKQHSMWYYFKVANVDAAECSLKITNAGECSFADGWPDSWAVVSYDHKTWFRVPTSYADGVLDIRFKAEAPVVWVAYFAPFSYEQHQALIAKAQLAKDYAGARLAQLEVLGSSLDGRDIELLTIGKGPLACWFIARQHPGETMAEWWMQGFLDRLLDPSDSVACKLRETATFYVVPNMNPDGSIRGHLRTNACGANLNREWGNTGDYEAPTMERSPEVFKTLQKIDITGCDLFVDVHGDEETPHVFLAGEPGVPKWGDRMAELYRLFCNAQLQADPSFQVEVHYGNDTAGDANLAICAAAVAERFDCLSTTLEMPYKDALEMLEPVHGWSAPRCEKLGASMLEAVRDVLPYVRAEFPFNNGGIGDGLEPPAWVVQGYQNPPSKGKCWPVDA